MHGCIIENPWSACTKWVVSFFHCNKTVPSHLVAAQFLKIMCLNVLHVYVVWVANIIYYFCTQQLTQEGSKSCCDSYNAAMKQGMYQVGMYLAHFVFIVLNSKCITFRSFINSIRLCMFTLPCKSNEGNTLKYKIHTQWLNQSHCNCNSCQATSKLVVSNRANNTPERM